MRSYWIVSALCCLVAVASHAQQGSPIITVQLINATDGKPVPRRGVLVYRINPDTHRPIVEQGMPLQGTADDDGRVLFPDEKLRSTPSENQSSNSGDKREAVSRQRLSKLLDLQITYAGGGIQCSTGLFSLDEIRTSGVVGDNHCNRKFDLTKFKRTPREVVIFVRKYRWWENGSE